MSTARARKEAAASFTKRRKEAGFKKVTVWLSPEAQKAVDAYMAAHNIPQAEAINDACGFLTES